MGYNPQKRGRKSFHPLLAVGAGTRRCPYYRFRRGDTVTASQWESAMAECQSWLGKAQVWLNRGDLGLGHERVCAWHEAQPGRPHYLFRLKLTANVKRAIAAVPEKDWQGPARLGVLPVAELTLHLPDWSCARRVVVGRRCLGEVSKDVSGTLWDEAKQEFEAYVTSLPAGEVNAWQIIELSRQRADTENGFDELKHQWGLEGFAAGSGMPRRGRRDWRCCFTTWGICFCGCSNRAAPAGTRHCDRMKTHPPTAEFRLIEGAGEGGQAHGGD